MNAPPMLARLREQFPRTGQVVDAGPVARRMRRICIAGDALRYLPWLPGQQIRVRMTPTIFMRDSLRTYSVWRYDAAAGAIELCVLLHGDGPGTRWARSAAVGDPVTFWGPRGKFVLDPDARYHVFAGEETAAVAIHAMLREAATCVALRRHFLAERGWPRGAVRVKPFWAPGKKGLE